MTTVLFVALGSGIGGAIRYLLGQLLQKPGAGFPGATMVINILGSLLLGVVLRHELQPGVLSPGSRAFLAAGFCGGFTTFSTFSAESLALLQQGALLRAGGYIAGSVLLSIAAAALGYFWFPRL